MTNRPFIIGIAGGSASGKSSVARAIIDKVGQSNMVHMCHDSYAFYDPLVIQLT